MWVTVVTWCDLLGKCRHQWNPAACDRSASCWDLDPALHPSSNASSSCGTVETTTYNNHLRKRSQLHELAICKFQIHGPNLETLRNSNGKLYSDIALSFLVIGPTSLAKTACSTRNSRSFRLLLDHVGRWSAVHVCPIKLFTPFQSSIEFLGAGKPSSLVMRGKPVNILFGGWLISHHFWSLGNCYTLGLLKVYTPLLLCQYIPVVHRLRYVRSMEYS